MEIYIMKGFNPNRHFYCVEQKIQNNICLVGKFEKEGEQYTFIKHREDIRITDKKETK